MDVHLLQPLASISGKRVTMWHRWPQVFILTLATSCHDEVRTVETRAAPPANAQAVSKAAAAPTPETAPPTGLTAAPRRKYGAADMKLDACVTAGDDQILRGRSCTSPFPIFGPYVDVPPNAETVVSFKIQSPLEVTLFSDVVSELGKHFHAGLTPQTVPRQERREVGYRVTIPQGTRALEARVGVRGPGPIDFDVSELTVEVR